VGSNSHVSGFQLPCRLPCRVGVSPARFTRVTSGKRIDCWHWHKMEQSTNSVQYSHGQCWLVVACCLLLVVYFVCFVVFWIPFILATLDRHIARSTGHSWCCCCWWWWCFHALLGFRCCCLVCSMRGFRIVGLLSSSCTLAVFRLLCSVSTISQ